MAECRRLGLAHRRNAGRRVQPPVRREAWSVSARYDAIVVGGGVAGGTAAILLAAAGWSVALVEKKTFPRRKVCGECIAAPNLALLDALGVGAEFAEVAGPPLTRVGLYVGEETLSANLPRLDGAGPGWARALGRERPAGPGVRSGSQAPSRRSGDGACGTWAGRRSSETKPGWSKRQC